MEVGQTQDELHESVSLAVEQGTQLARTIDGRRWAHVPSLSRDERPLPRHLAAARIVVRVRAGAGTLARFQRRAQPCPNAMVVIARAASDECTFSIETCQEQFQNNFK